MTATPKCVTHHYACDCREAKFTDLQKEVERLRKAIEDAAICLFSGARALQTFVPGSEAEVLQRATMDAHKILYEALQTPPESGACNTTSDTNLCDTESPHKEYEPVPYHICRTASGADEGICHKCGVTLFAIVPQNSPQCSKEKEVEP